MIEKIVGETVKIERTVLNSLGENAVLTGATAKFAMHSRFGNVEINKTCTIVGSVISVTLTPSDTAIAGTYDYEFKVKLNGEYDSVEQGELVLTKTLIPSTF